MTREQQSIGFVIARHANLVKRSLTIANIPNEITKDGSLFTFVFLRECLGPLLAVCWQVRGAPGAENSGALTTEKSAALSRPWSREPHCLSECSDDENASSASRPCTLQGKRLDFI